MHLAPRHFSHTSRLSRALLAALVAGLAACGGGDDGGAGAGGGGGPPSLADDIRTAQQFFGNLRNNANALQSSATGTGISDGVETFGEVVQVDAALLATAAADSIRLDRMAFELWDDYRNGRTASNTRNHDGSFSGCTVFEGAFPTSLGPLNTDFVTSSVAAVSPAAATWVGCSKNSGPLAPTGARRYRQTKLYDMAGAIAAGSFPGAVPYLAGTRSQFRDTSVTPAVDKVRNLTPMFAGTVGVMPAANANLINTRLRGDLPPLTDGNGTLLADHYVADVDGSVATHGSGAEEIRLNAGKFTSVPLASSTGTPLVIDLAAGTAAGGAGPSLVILPVDETVAAQRQAAQVAVHGTITHDTGRMVGSLLADRFDIDAGGDLVPNHVRFTGEVAVRPQGGTALVSFLKGTLDATNGSSSPATVDFEGRLTLPGQPEAVLTVKATETSSDTEAFNGSYTQNGLTVNFEGTHVPGLTTTTFSSSTGVRTTVLSNANTAEVTVDGRRVGVIRRDTRSVVYDNGDIESLL